MLYKLKLGEDDRVSLATSGFNVETIEYKNVIFTVWDFGGSCRMRPMWHHYCQDAQGVIFVVDSSDTERLAEAKCELATMLNVCKLFYCFIVVDSIFLHIVFSSSYYIVSVALGGRRDCRSACR